MPTLQWLTREEDLKSAVKAEYRLLVEDEKLSYGDPDTGNLIVQGDNLEALKALLPFYAGQVKCIYIDPPYNTGEAFLEYDDNLEHSIWLGIMYCRLELLYSFLSEDGVIFVQLNDDEMNYCKVIMDEIFGRNNFVNLVSVKTKNSSGASGGGEDKRLKKNIEYLICYGKPNFSKFNPVFTPVELSEYLEDMRINDVSFKYTTVFTDLGKREYYKTIKDGSGSDIIIYKHSHYETKSIARLAIDDGITEIEVFNKYYENICTTENAQTSIRTRVLEATDNEENLYSIEYYPISGRNKGKLTTVHFVGKTKRLVSWFKNVCIKERGYIFKKEKIGSLWDDLNWNNVNREGGVVFTGGKKPEVLIERILNLATNPGDLVLDSFLGSGTTAAVAHKMDRRYIGVEMGEHAKTHCAVRLKKVIDGEQGGISEAVGWKGGGGFRFFTLGEAVFDNEKHIKEGISFEHLAAHVYFTETKKPMPRDRFAARQRKKSAFLGIHEGTAYALLYNGILGDKSIDGGNVLTHKTLNHIMNEIEKAAKENKAELEYDQLVVYGEATRLTYVSLESKNIIFKQIPYDIKVW